MSTMYLGIFFIIWGVLYLVFAFVAKENTAVRGIFKVPFIFVILPDRMVIPVGRVFSGLLCIGGGIYFLYYMSQFA